MTIPRISPALHIIDPTALPTARELYPAVSAASFAAMPFITEVAEVIISGRVVPIDTTVAPMTISGTRKARATATLSEWARRQKPQDITLMIGPEGGFSPEEETLAEQQGVTFLSMGPRILRTETAGLAAVAAINALWETRQAP